MEERRNQQKVYAALEKELEKKEEELRKREEAILKKSEKELEKKEEELSKKEEELEKINGQVQSVFKKLNNRDFLERAPRDVATLTRELQDLLYDLCVREFYVHNQRGFFLCWRYTPVPVTLAVARLVLES